jgi:peptidoglycan/LPS O-acetylase OafA/YrhL
MVPGPGSSSRVFTAAGGVAGAGFLPVLDGLRAVSILLVVFSHLGLDHVVPGAFGVTLFFFISGYLITRQLRAALMRDGRIGFARFYLRRGLRLVPAGVAYIGVAGLAYCAAGGVISPLGWAAALLYSANYYDLWAGYHSTLPGIRHPFNILWSLAIEEHFYLLWPACLALLWRGRGAVAGLLVLCGAILLWRLCLWHGCFVPGAPWVCGPENPNPAWRFNRLYLATDTRLDSIAWGALLALRGGGGGQVAAGREALWGGALLLASFMVPGPFGRFVLRPTLQGLALLALFGWLLEGDSLLHRGLRCGPARMLGRLSYSLYLWHWLALGVADALMPRGGVVWVVLAVGLAFVLAAGSYEGIERPMLRWRRRFGSHAAG